MLDKHFAQDVADGSAPVLGDGMDELSSGSGELKSQVTTIGGVITSAQQTLLDEFVAGLSK
jgi:X-X-X-Leu-X-X-Gly heptad repeat protein